MFSHLFIETTSAFGQTKAAEENKIIGTFSVISNRYELMDENLWSTTREKPERLPLLIC